MGSVITFRVICLGLFGYIFFCRGCLNRNRFSWFLLDRPISAPLTRVKGNNDHVLKVNHGLRVGGWLRLLLLLQRSALLSIIAIARPCFESLAPPTMIDRGRKLGFWCVDDRFGITLSRSDDRVQHFIATALRQVAQRIKDTLASIIDSIWIRWVNSSLRVTTINLSTMNA